MIEDSQHLSATIMRMPRVSRISFYLFEQFTNKVSRRAFDFRYSVSSVVFQALAKQGRFFNLFSIENRLRNR